MDINCTMTEMAREKGTTLNDFNTGRVIEVKMFWLNCIVLVE